MGSAGREEYLGPAVHGQQIRMPKVNLIMSSKKKGLPRGQPCIAA
jgi:hypothetical protein